jgi:hypothetical protein
MMGLRLDDPLSPVVPWPGLVRVEWQIAYVMVFGFPTPRPLEQAAKDHNYKVARVRRRARSQARRAANGQ